MTRLASATVERSSDYRRRRFRPRDTVRGANASLLALTFDRKRPDKERGRERERSSLYSQVGRYTTSLPILLACRLSLFLSFGVFKRRLNLSAKPKATRQKCQKKGYRVAPRGRVCLPVLRRSIMLAVALLVFVPPRRWKS